MKRPPFVMKSSRHATLTCDGKFVVGGRASFVWETFLMRRAAGVSGRHEIRRDERGPWHHVDLTIDEAEQQLASWSPTFGARRIRQARVTRANRQRQGLEVA